MERLLVVTALILSACQASGPEEVADHRAEAPEVVAATVGPWDPLVGVSQAAGVGPAVESLALWRELTGNLDANRRSGRALEGATVACEAKELIVWVDASLGGWHAFGPARVMTCKGVTLAEVAAIQRALNQLVTVDPERAAFACWVGRTHPATGLALRATQVERQRILAGLRERLPGLIVGDYDCDFASAESRRVGGAVG